MEAKLSLVLCVVAMCAIINMARGASPTDNNAPAQDVNCYSVWLTLGDCLSYVTNGSTITEPEGSCCSVLKNVLKTSPYCFCDGLKDSTQFGIVVNVTKALTLPAACNCKVSASTAKDCGLSEAPGAGPAGSLTLESSPPSPKSGAAATEPTPGKNSASELHPITAASVLISLLIAAFSAF